MSKLIHEELTYAVRGVLFDVHNQLGPGLREELNRDAIAIGLEAKGIAYQTEKSFQVFYRGQQVGLYYVDVWVEGGKALLEIKVALEITALHQAQALSYLKVTDADLALVVNFGAQSLEVQRLPNFLRNKSVTFAWEDRPLAADLPHPALVRQILKACYRVHFELGPGFLHQVYRRAVMVELPHQEVSFTYLKEIPITYQGQQIGWQPVRLISVAGEVLVAAVAFNQISDTMKQQFKVRLNQLKAQLGLLANFNGTALDVIIVRTTTD